MTKLQERLLKLNIHTITIRPSKIDGKISLSLDAEQSCNYQNAKYKMYHDNIDEMFEEVIERGEQFYNLTKGKFSPNKTNYLTGMNTAGVK